MRSRGSAHCGTQRRDDGHWLTPYADELLKDVAPRFGIELPDRTREVADRLRAEADQLMFRLPPADVDAEVEAIEREVQRRWP
jgi:hypothetical protein